MAIFPRRYGQGDDTLSLLGEETGQLGKKGTEPLQKAFHEYSVDTGAGAVLLLGQHVSAGSITELTENLRHCYRTVFVSTKFARLARSHRGRTSTKKF